MYKCMGGWEGGIAHLPRTLKPAEVPENLSNINHGEPTLYKKLRGKHAIDFILDHSNV
jgi:hypothetical protein